MEGIQVEVQQSMIGNYIYKHIKKNIMLILY